MKTPREEIPFTVRLYDPGRARTTEVRVGPSDIVVADLIIGELVHAGVLGTSAMRRTWTVSDLLKLVGERTGADL